MKKRLYAVLLTSVFLFLTGCGVEPEVSGGMNVEGEAITGGQGSEVQADGRQESVQSGSVVQVPGAQEGADVQTTPATEAEYAGTTPNKEDVAETGSSADVGQATVRQDVIDKDELETLISQVEAEVVRLEEKLYTDGFLSQADMNDISYEIYELWDDTLNTVWKDLKDSLDEATMKQLLEEQRQWITDKEAAVKQTGESVGGGSLAILVCNQKAAELTRERVYELAEYVGCTVSTFTQNE